MWFHRRHQFWVEGCDKIVIVLLFVWMGEDAPGQIVDIPSVYKVDIGKSQCDRSFRLGESCDEKIGAQRDRRSNSSLGTYQQYLGSRMAH